MKLIVLLGVQKKSRALLTEMLAAVALTGAGAAFYKWKRQPARIVVPPPEPPPPILQVSRITEPPTAAARQPQDLVIQSLKAGLK
jgi:hypothetical protein